MGSDSDGYDYESLTTLLAVSRDCLTRQTQETHVLVEDEDSPRLRHVVVDARDRRERGGRHPSSREAHTACFPSPYLKSFICVCPEMLWCSQLVRVCT